MTQKEPDKPVAAGETAGPSVTDDELQASLSGPAVHSNKVYATNTGAGVRLAFMEMHGEKFTPQFRAAVILSYPDAIQLRHLLSRLLKDLESAMAVEIEIGVNGKPVIRNGKKT